MSSSGIPINLCMDFNLFAPVENKKILVTLLAGDVIDILYVLLFYDIARNIITHNKSIINII